MRFGTLLGGIALGVSSLLMGAEGAANTPLNLNNDFFLFLDQSVKIFNQNNDLRGFLTIGGVTAQVIDAKIFTFIEGIFRDAFVNRGLVIDAEGNVLDRTAIPGTAQLQLNALLTVKDGGVQFNNANQNLEEAIAANFNNVFNVVGFDFTQEFDQLALYSAILVNIQALAHSPGMFCINNLQCESIRGINNNFGSIVQRTCLATDKTFTTCNDFVAFFTLRWLLGWIILVYIILILWATYMLYPRFKRKFCSKKNAAAARAKATPEYTEQEQLIINTLASQCASAENMLFQATDMLKQAKNMKNILAVEARRENRLMQLTVEYFQAMAAILVSLTHQYLDQKTFTPGEKFNDADPATRALQLEVLNYCRERLQLAFQADAFTEKSLLRIAEAYAILKRMSDSLVLVGFSADQEAEDGLGQLRTPIVNITENAIFMSGIFKASRGGLDRDIEGQEVCIPIKNADNRGMKEVGALYYLSDSSKDAKNYDPQLQTVKASNGKSLVYSLTNAGTQGETLQYFVRTFWGPEIAAIQQEASTWLTNDTSMENWIERERAERERKAAPVVKRGAKKKRKKNKHKKDKYKEDGEKSEYSESQYTEASGWSVASNNTFVYSVQSIVNQGLGIAGKPGLPYDKLGTSQRKSSKFFQWFQRWFPNAAEWPKFYIFIFVIMPIVIIIPMLAQIGKGSGAIDIDGNVPFKARPAGFGTSFLGVPAYYFLDGEVPELDNLAPAAAVANEPDVLDILAILGANGGNVDPFNNGGAVFMNNNFVFQQFLQFDGANNKKPDNSVAEIQAGVLTQLNVDGLTAIKDQQKAQEVGTAIVYGLMHCAGYFFGIVPLSLVRESLEIIARRFPVVRDIYPMSQWRDLHMNMGLAGIFYVTFGATAFLVMILVGMGKNTPFVSLGGDPEIKNFFDFNDNVLYLRQLLLPAVPLLLLMKYASRGPPMWMKKYAPNFITKNYWEICYFLHYLTALTAIIMLVLYRPQVFYWMGATWGFVWGGNKIVRILRTRKTTIKNTNLISYSVEDKRNNAKKRSDVLRIQLNVPRSFPSSSRGQACWITVPDIDFIAHPFTLAKVPTPDDPSIMFHIGIKYLDGDDIIEYARPESAAVVKKVEAPPANPNEMPPGWKMATDPESGQTYYYNSAERRTTWTRPKANAMDKMMEGARALTSRFSTNMIRGAGSTRLGQVGLNGGADIKGVRTLTTGNRATWTQRLAKLGQKLSTMDPDLRRNAIKDFPVYVSAPLGTSMDDCLLPSLPGSIIITTQNGLPAAESSVRWLLMQGKTQRPKFHFFVSVSREVNDALSVVETLRDGICDSVVAGNLDIDGLNPRHAHMADWLGVYIHLTRRKPSQIEGDREMLMKSLNPPAAPVTPQQLKVIEDWVKNRVCPGRLPFDRFLQRTSQMVQKRTGLDRIAVGYCGSAKIAYSIRAAAREIPNMTFDGEYI